MKKVLLIMIVAAGFLTPVSSIFAVEKNGIHLYGNPQGTGKPVGCGLQGDDCYWGPPPA